MTHCIGDNTVVEFVEGTLPPSRVAEVERHIVRCEPCRLRLVAIGTSPSRLLDSPAPPPRIPAYQWLVPGTEIDRFIVLHHLGHGGMGMVVAAYDTQLHRRVALKLLRPERSEHDARHEGNADARCDHRDMGGLLAEARTMAGLDHPNIVSLHEVGTFRGELFLVMELVHGTTLARWLNQIPERPWPSIVEAFRQAGRALAYAHDKRVAHGDFKPENLLVDTRGRVRISDFGLSRYMPIGERVANPENRRSMVMGTPRYMAPEQYAGQPADARSDQFSFCVTLYEALYGQHPCAHDTPRSLLELPSERAWRAAPKNADVPEWLARVLARGLSIDPASRYDSMYSLVAELVPPVPARRSRVRGALMTTSVVLACALTFVVGREMADPLPARAYLAANAGHGGLPERAHATARTTPDPAPGFAPGRTSSPSRGAARATPEASAVDPGTHRTDDIPSDPDARPRVHGGASVPPAARDGIYQSYQEYGNATPGMGTSRVQKRIHDWSAEPAAPGEPGTARASERAGHVRDIRPRAQKPTPTRLSGPALSTRAIRKRLERSHYDLDVCVREWRERRPNASRIFVAGLRIDASGAAQVHRFDNVRDVVLRKCVGEALQAIQFPRSRGDSLVDLHFTSRGDSPAHEGALDVTIVARTRLR